MALNWPLDWTMPASDTAVSEDPDILLAAIERAGEAVVIVDRDHHVSHFNAAAERIWRLNRADLLGRHVGRLGLGDLPSDQVAAPAEAPINGENAIAGSGSEITIQRQDGSRVRAALSLSRIDAGDQSRTIAFVRDITAEVDRRERIALLTLVADTTNRAVVVTDRNLRIVYINAAFAGMFGYSSEQAIGRQALELLVGRHTDRKALARLRRRISEEGCGEEEILAYDRNGDDIWISTNIQTFRNSRGRVKQTFALLTDITETKQLRSLQQLIMTALAALQDHATRGWPASLLVDAHHGQGRPRDRNLRLLFQGMPPAESLASAHRRRLRPSRRARDRAQGSARPDRAARLL
jgi:PAS domain S-box-containing protein